MRVTRSSPSPLEMSSLQKGFCERTLTGCPSGHWSGRTHNRERNQARGRRGCMGGINFSGGSRLTWLGGYTADKICQSGGGGLHQQIDWLNSICLNEAIYFS